MRNYKTETITEDLEVQISVTCDKCGKTQSGLMEVQEWHFIDFVGGYLSVFGDMNRVEAEVCQECLLGMIGEFCRKTDTSQIAEWLKIYGDDSSGGASSANMK